jgi:hypothetical protein
MLISMPTGTSTIFGAFQAIWLSLQTGRISALAIKLPCEKKFASEIFLVKLATNIVAVQKRVAET